MLTAIEFETTGSESLVNITQQIQEVVRLSNIEEGICIVYVPHTTAAITINSAMDPNTLLDVVSELHRLVPTRVDFKHIYDTPADAAGHIKSVLVGQSVSLIISNHQLVMGSSQSILFFEFDGPRARKVFVRLLKD